MHASGEEENFISSGKMFQFLTVLLLVTADVLSGLYLWVNLSIQDGRHHILKNLKYDNFETKQAITIFIFQIPYFVLDKSNFYCYCINRPPPPRAQPPRFF